MQGGSPLCTWPRKAQRATQNCKRAGKIRKGGSEKEEGRDNFPEGASEGRRTGGHASRRARRNRDRAPMLRSPLRESRKRGLIRFALRARIRRSLRAGEPENIGGGRLIALSPGSAGRGEPDTSPRQAANERGARKDSHKPPTQPSLGLCPTGGTKAYQHFHVINHFATITNLPPTGALCRTPREAGGPTVNMAPSSERRGTVRNKTAQTTTTQRCLASVGGIRPPSKGQGLQPQTRLVFNIRFS